MVVRRYRGLDGRMRISTLALSSSQSHAPAGGSVIAEFGCTLGEIGPDFGPNQAVTRAESETTRIRAILRRHSLHFYPHSSSSVPPPSCLRKIIGDCDVGKYHDSFFFGPFAVKSVVYFNHNWHLLVDTMPCRALLDVASLT